MQSRWIPAIFTSLTLLLAGCGNASESAGNTNLKLFDNTVVHNIEVSFDQDDYDAMIATLADNGDKDWIRVSVSIDGVTFPDAGARLKGNSTLASLSGGGPFGGQNRFRANGNGPGGNRGGFGGGRMGGPGNSASADEPEKLPWLIRLDRYSKDEKYQGYSDLVIRANNSETSLNEAVALDLLNQAGLVSQDPAYVRFSVNGTRTALRLMIEHPADVAWQENHFADKGALYKAESSGNWSYRGDDPESYTDVFDQQGGNKVADLSPLIDFLKFINESDDATFASELPKLLDVDAFATYLAMMQLVQNFDDIDGPGNNAYLWWDATSKQFTIVPWDLNLAFSTMGGGRGGFPGGGMPDGFGPPGGFQIPGGFGGGFGGRGGFGRSNPLVQRFNNTEAFQQLYQQKLSALKQNLFESGSAVKTVSLWQSLLLDQVTDLVDADTIDQEASNILMAIMDE